MLKKGLLVAVAITLFALPLVIRWLYFFEGSYQPGEVARPVLAEIHAPASEPARFADQHSRAQPGTVLVDAMHDNRFSMTELSVLQARLAARSLDLKLVGTDDDLVSQLRNAKALLVICPGTSWTRDEIRQARSFVEKGGRLLLVTDPTRFGVVLDEFDEYAGLDSDADYINDLAAEFGIVFQSDYLYNTTVNEGNFRNIGLTDLSDDALTRGLEKIVFFATHSIVSDTPSLVAADGETRSSSDDVSEKLSVSVLAAGGSVLALGDLTFMTEPYNTIHDNDRFVANIADFLAGARRRYDLADFPFFFGDKVDLVYAGEPLLDSDLLRGGSALQEYFRGVAKELEVREVEDPTSDTLFFGLYEEAGDAEAYLTAAQLTLWITPTTDTDDSDRAGREPSVAPTITSTYRSDVDVGTQITTTGEVTPELGNHVGVAGFGKMVTSGTSLFLLEPVGERQILVVLADTEEGLQNAVERLTEGSLADCLRRETEAPEDSVSSSLALCSTGEVATGEGIGGWTRPDSQPKAPEISATPTPSATQETNEGVPEGPSGEGRGRIFVVALDDEEGRYDGLTSTDAYAAALADRYEVTTWSKSQDGEPKVADYLNYDLVIWTSGDFENTFGQEESDLLFLVLLEGIPVIVSGAYVGDSEVESLQLDIRVSDAQHPMTAGFDPQQVISFQPSPSGSEYETQLLRDSDPGQGTTIPFTRGPESEDEGAPAVLVLEEPTSDIHVVFMGFPVYMLPEPERSRLVLNTVDWLLTP